MKKIFFKLSKSIIIGFLAVVLVSVGIDAADHFDNFSESIIGRFLGSKPESLCPVDMIFVSTAKGGFCIDKYEASVSEYCPYPEPINAAQTQANIDDPDKKCKPMAISGKKPWTNISQNQAARACAKAGKRLASNKEWLQAALGTPDATENWGPDDCQVNNNWDKQPGLTGSGKKCVSFVGAYDMIGNVWEWVDGAVQNGKIDGQELPAQGFVQAINEDIAMPADTGVNGNNEYYNDYFWLKQKDTRAIARGGYWNNKKEAGQYAVYAVLPPAAEGAGVGFRCAK